MIQLDRVRVRAEDIEPITVPVDRARIAVVATGADAERVRGICHQLQIFVPILANVAIVHESLPMVVFGEPSPPAPERVVHVVRPSIADEPLRELLHALGTGRVPMPPPSRAIAADPPVLTQARKLESATDLAAIETFAVDAIKELTGSDRAYCLAYEADGQLWSEALRRRSGDDRTAFAGLAGWSARTGLPAHATCAGDDPRWFPQIDDPEGKAQTRIVVHPIVTDARRVRAVLVSVRRWRHAAFTDNDRRWLATYAELAGPIIERILSRPVTIPPPLEESDEGEDEEIEEIEPEPSEGTKTGVMMRVEPPPEDTTVEAIPTVPFERQPPSTTLQGLPDKPRAPGEDRMARRRAAEAAVAAARKALEEAEAALAAAADDDE